MPTKKEFKIILPVIIIIGMFIFFSDPTKGPILPCTFNKVTGLYCPGCGMTRAVHSVLRLKFYDALRYNALIFIIPIILIFYIVFIYNRYIRLSKLALILMIVIALGYGIIRNIEAFRHLSWITL